MISLLALFLTGYGYAPPAPTGTVVERYTIGERAASIAVGTGRTQRLRLDVRPPRHFLRVEHCEYLRSGEACTFVVEVIEVSRSQWLASPPGSAFTAEEPEEWWQ